MIVMSLRTFIIKVLVLILSKFLMITSLKVIENYCLKGNLMLL